jgi:hypothetical protein
MSSTGPVSPASNKYFVNNEKVRSSCVKNDNGLPRLTSKKKGTETYTILDVDVRMGGQIKTYQVNIREKGDLGQKVIALLKNPATCEQAVQHLAELVAVSEAARGSSGTWDDWAFSSPFGGQGHKFRYFWDSKPQDTKTAGAKGELHVQHDRKGRYGALFLDINPVEVGNRKKDGKEKTSTVAKPGNAGNAATEILKNLLKLADTPLKNGESDNFSEASKTDPQRRNDSSSAPMVISALRSPSTNQQSHPLSSDMDDKHSKNSNS